MWSKRPRRSLFSSITAPTSSFGTMIDARTYGSSTSSTLARQLGGVVHLDHLAGLRRDR